MREQVQSARAVGWAEGRCASDDEDDAAEDLGALRAVAARNKSKRSQARSKADHFSSALYQASRTKF